MNPTGKVGSSTTEQTRFAVQKKSLKANPFNQGSEDGGVFQVHHKEREEDERRRAHIWLVLLNSFITAAAPDDTVVVSVAARVKTSKSKKYPHRVIKAVI